MFFRILKVRNAKAGGHGDSAHTRARAAGSGRLNLGAYESVEEVVDAALAAVEQRTVPGFAGTPEELDALLAEGLASRELAEDEFWGSVNARTDILIAERKSGSLS